MTSSYKVIYEAFQCVCWPPSLRLFSILHIICIEDNCLPGNRQVMQLCWWSPLFDDSPPLASSVVCPSSLVLLFPLEAQTPCIRTRAQLLLAVTLFLFFPFSPRRTRRKGGKEWGSSRKALGDWQQCPLMMHYLPAEAGSFWGSSRQHTKMSVRALKLTLPAFIHSLLLKTFCPSAMPTSSMAALWLSTLPVSPGLLLDSLSKSKSGLCKTSLNGFESGQPPDLSFHKTCFLPMLY